MPFQVAILGCKNVLTKPMDLEKICSSGGVGYLIPKYSEYFFYATTFHDTSIGAGLGDVKAVRNPSSISIPNHRNSPFSQRLKLVTRDTM